MSECKQKLFIHGHSVPCGHCADCVSKIKRDWVCRCLLEYHMCKSRALHVCLTFDDFHLDDTSYRQVQLFLKRLRKNYKIKFRYFGSYENGTLSGRPHYHIIFFGILDEIRTQDFAKAWKNGYVKVRVCSENTLPYVVGYVQKKRLTNFDRSFAKEMGYRTFNSYNKYNTDSPVRENFYFMSKGLGMQKKILESVIKKNPFALKFTFGQYVYGIPRAIVQKIKRLYDLDIYKELIMSEEYNKYLSGVPSNYFLLSVTDLFSSSSNPTELRCLVSCPEGSLKDFQCHNLAWPSDFRKACLPLDYSRPVYEEDVYDVF